MAKMLEVQLTDKKFKIASRWKGKNLAVHAPIRNGKVQRERAYWVITHVQSGLVAAIMFSVNNAIKVAREWDSLFDEFDSNKPRQWVMRDDWNKVVDLAG
jgi:hypothetical protein